MNEFLNFFDEPRGCCGKKSMGVYAGGFGGQVMFKVYNIPAWEPCFKEIAPILSKFYFSTRVGFIRRILAGMIFKKLRWLEGQNY